uniref:centrin-1-like n=1 Tax=Erigeron canadensis TaxID=72917 RepID=UPI001CB9D612|nr:centrin-1-like [Erigeron canadensis]XP_043623287.1 centrin-1-like [Erigeron canadensis]
MKAIALSLQDSPGFLDVASNTPPQPIDTKALSVRNIERKHIVHKDDSETGKGEINLRDLRRVAASHDFTWNDEEMDHMIRFFDSDVDGKLSLEDFSKIVERCNMRQGSEISEQAS